MFLITIVTQERHQSPLTALCAMVTPAQAEQVKWVQLAQFVFAIPKIYFLTPALDENLKNPKQQTTKHQCN